MKAKCIKTIKRFTLNFFFVGVFLASVTCVSTGIAGTLDFKKSPTPYLFKWSVDISHSAMSIAFGANDSMLAVAGSDLIILDTQTGAELKKWWPSNSVHGSYVAFSPTDDTLVVDTMGGRADKPIRGQFFAFRRINMKTGEVLGVESPYGTGARSVHFSPSGDVAVALFGPHEKGKIAVYDSKTWGVIRTMAPDSRIGGTMALSPDDIHVVVDIRLDVSGEPRYALQTWNYRSGKLSKESVDNFRFIEDLAYVNSGNEIAISRRHIVRKKDNGKYVSVTGLSFFDSDQLKLEKSQEPQGDIKRLGSVHSPRKGKIVAARTNSGISLFSYPSMKAVQHIKGRGPFAVTFSKGGEYLAITMRSSSKPGAKYRIAMWELSKDHLKKGDL